MFALVWFQTILLVDFAGQAGFYHQENRVVRGFACVVGPR